MQLFGLVNSLLAADRQTAERDLSIARYAVIPLSPNSGLIGWVPNCDTLHALIRWVEIRSLRDEETALGSCLGRQKGCTLGRMDEDMNQMKQSQRRLAAGVGVGTSPAHGSWLQVA
jgi:hypothetical protein